MTQDMSDDMVKQAIIDLQELVRCICSPALKDRNLHSPDCRGYDASNVALLSDRIEELEAKLAKAVELALEECPFHWGTLGHNDWWHDRRTTLAELKGDKP
jgi:hypothetical protein